MKGLMISLKKWAEAHDSIESVIVVGSYARGTNRPTSDLDIVIITPNKTDLVQQPSFAEEFGDTERSQMEYYGANTTIRVWYKDGKEVEFGIVEPSWLAIPLDEGTFRVLNDGYKVIFDRNNRFSELKLD